MKKCDTCGNEYERTFEVDFEGARYVFDCFECAAERLAPRCEVCGVRVLGHGVEQGSSIFCCASCARKAGVSELRDSA
jgi:hypothetical protein